MVGHRLRRSHACCTDKWDPASQPGAGHPAASQPRLLHRQSGTQFHSRAPGTPPRGNGRRSMADLQELIVAEKTAEKAEAAAEEAEAAAQSAEAEAEAAAAKAAAEARLAADLEATAAEKEAALQKARRAQPVSMRKRGHALAALRVARTVGRCAMPAARRRAEARSGAARAGPVSGLLRQAPPHSRLLAN